MKMSQEVYELEAVDGVRMPWNLWPRSKVEALRCVLPCAVLYTPVKSIQGMRVRPVT
jgi:protein transport protein SEC23